MKLKDIKDLPYKVYLWSNFGSSTFIRDDFDRTKYDNCDCHWEDYEDDYGSDTNGRPMISQGTFLFVDDFNVIKEEVLEIIVENEVNVYNLLTDIRIANETDDNVSYKDYLNNIKSYSLKKLDEEDFYLMRRYLERSRL